jgi:hypothetical protein
MLDERRRWSSGILKSNMGKVARGQSKSPLQVAQKKIKIAH